MNLLDYTPTVFYFCHSAKNEFSYNIDAASSALRGTGNAPFQCTLCGARFKTGIVAESISGGDAITLGMDCAETMELAQLVADCTGEIEKLRADAAREKTENRVKIWAMGRPEMFEFLESKKDKNNFFESLYSALYQWGSLTGGQMEALDRAMKREKEEESENKIAAPSGRTTFTGVVVGIKPPPAYAEFPTWKAIIKVKSGNDVWLTMGGIGKQLDDLDRGDTVTMTATLRAGRDPSFVFYSRPSKVSITKGPNATDELCSGAPRSNSLAMM